MRVANCVQTTSTFVITPPCTPKPGASAVPPGKALKIEGMRSRRASTGTAVPTVTRLESLGSWSFWRQVVSDAARSHPSWASSSTPQKGQNRSLRDTLNGLPPTWVNQLPDPILAAWAPDADGAVGCGCGVHGRVLLTHRRDCRVLASRVEEAKAVRLHPHRRRQDALGQGPSCLPESLLPPASAVIHSIACASHVRLVVVP